MTAGVRSDDVTEECWTGWHQSCTGYTEPAWDPDLCNCQCHDDQEAAYVEAAYLSARRNKEPS